MWDVGSNEIISDNKSEGNSGRRISTCIPVFDLTGKLLAISDRSLGYIVILDTSSGNEIASLNFGEDPMVSNLQFLSHANILVSIGSKSTHSFDDGIARLWKTNNWEERTPTQLPKILLQFPSQLNATPIISENGNLLVTLPKGGV